jgi:hypothetical protein
MHAYQRASPTDASVRAQSYQDAGTMLRGRLLLFASVLFFAHIQWLEAVKVDQHPCKVSSHAVLNPEGHPQVYALPLGRLIFRSAKRTPVKPPPLSEMLLLCTCGWIVVLGPAIFSITSASRAGRLFSKVGRNFLSLL